MSKTHDQLIDQIGNMSVLELADLVKQLEEKFGVSAAMPVAAAAAPQAGQAEGQQAEEKTEFKVELTAGGSKTIDTIKALRKVTTLGLSEAKNAVVNAPTVIAESASKEDANKMKEALEAAGAKVTLS